jgi:hypothetical protein
MRQLIEDLISMMEYHVEQTRPIHTTTVALQAAREALKSLPAQPAPVQEPVAWRAWFDADNGARWLFTLWPEEERLDVEWQPLFTPPPAQRQWVGLTDDEIDKTYETKIWDARRSYARAIEAKLKEKNT